MKTIGKLVLFLSMLGLAGGAFAEGAGEQITPGASHGPTTVNPSGPGRSGSDAGAAACVGQAARGGSSNGTSTSGMGTTQSSGGIQPRLDRNGNGGSSQAALDRHEWWDARFVTRLVIMRALNRRRPCLTYAPVE